MRKNIKVSIVAVTLAVTAGGVTTYVETPWDGEISELAVPELVLPEAPEIVIPEPEADLEPVEVAGTFGGTAGGGFGNTTVAAAAGFPSSYDTTCLEDATDGQDDTPSTIAWVADDGGTTNTGSFDDPYDYNEQLLGVTTSDNANKVDLWGDGARTVCWKKVASDYELIDGGTASLAWNQGPLLNTSPTQGLVNFAYPAAPLNVGSDAAFESTTLFAGLDEMISQTIDPGNANARGAGEWYGFRFGEIGTTERGGFRIWGPTSTSQDPTVKVEWNYFASSLESDYTTGGSGNDSSLYMGATQDATTRFNYFAQVLVNASRSSKAWAGVRSYFSHGWEVSNNTFALCDPDSETANSWDFMFPKRDGDDFTAARNMMYVLDGGASCDNHINGATFQGGDVGSDDANVSLWERNVYWNAIGSFNAFIFNFSSDSLVSRYNLIQNVDRGFDQGSAAVESCDGTNQDEYQSDSNEFDANIFIDVGSYLVRWFSHLTNRPTSVDDNAIHFVDKTLGNYIRESHRGGGTYTDCGGATTADVGTSIATLNALSYATGNSDADPRMVCQYEGNNKCDGGTPAAPDDIRFCTGVNTPVVGCPGASPHVDGSGIAQIGPYQGENMNNDPSTYTVQLGAGWLPPASHR